MPHQGGRSAAPQLGDLDDHTLLACFSHLTPLPDLFNVAASCRRFRDLALDRRSWLYVTHAGAAPAPGALASPPPRGERPRQPPPARAASTASLGIAAVEDGPHWYRSQFCSLEAAVAASRPGDTILLAAGPEPHLVQAPVVVRHPVHILGGGSEAGECVLVGARGIEALVDFRASGRLATLTLRATAGACVAHTRGRLTVQGCTLDCDARGLPHLSAPLITRAVSSPPLPATPVGVERLPAPPAAALAGQKRPASGSSSVGAAADAAGSPAAPAAKRLRPWRSAAEAAAGAGVLCVVETRIKARGAAVDLRGSGRLSSVRAIYSTGHALVWLEVDSAAAAPPTSRPSGTAAAAATAVAAGGQAPAVVATPLPSWLPRAAAAGFDAGAFQVRAAALACPAQPSAQQAAEDGAGVIERKAEAWCLHHHTSLADKTAPLPHASD